MSRSGNRWNDIDDGVWMHNRLSSSPRSHLIWQFVGSLIAGCLPIVGCLLCHSAGAQAQGTSTYSFPGADVVPPAQSFIPLVQGPIVEPMIASPGLDFAAPDPVVVEGISWLPDWMDPAVWLSPVFWGGSFELGINGAAGNADAFSMQTGFEVSRETEHTNWDIDFAYAKNESFGIDTQNNALLWSNWDYKLANPRWSWFNKILFEYDEFKEFDLRLALNGGLGYLFIDTPITQFRGRFGAGTSREFDSTDDDWKPEAVFGIDFTRQLTARQNFTVTVDYFPTWDDFSDYRIVTDAGWQLLLDEAANMSLKVGVIDRYDSTPGSAEPNDFNYSVMLLWSI